MKLTKETLKKIIKEELDAAMEESVIEEGSRPSAYFNQSMLSGDRALELRYQVNGEGKRIDFRYRYMAPKYRPEEVERAVHSLANKKGKTLGSIKYLAEIIFDVLNRKMSSDKPTLEQIKSMPVYFG